MDQQDKHSPSYHKWLTPETFGQQFGPTHADMRRISTWLQSHGFQVGSTKGRTVLEFSGTAAQAAGSLSHHNPQVLGEQASNTGRRAILKIPSALMPAVSGIASLNNFSRRAMNAPAGAFSRDNKSGKTQPASLFTYLPGFQCTRQVTATPVVPYDFATITRNSGINDRADDRDRRRIEHQRAGRYEFSRHVWPAGEQSERDFERSRSRRPAGRVGSRHRRAVVRAAAPNATIDFVVSQSTETTHGVDLSAVYIVENNLAGVMSESYGGCLTQSPTSGNQFFSTLWQQRLPSHCSWLRPETAAPQHVTGSTGKRQILAVFTGSR